MSDKIITREVREEDNIQLAAIIRQVFEEHNAPRVGTVYSDPTTDNLYNVFRAPRSVLWVAASEKNAAGCCGIYPTKGLDEDCAELVKFYLAQEARGTGTGKILMEKCIRSAKELQYKRLYLESLPHFPKAIKMYETLGFAKLENPLGNSGHTTCNIWMIKNL